MSARRISLLAIVFAVLLFPSLFAQATASGD